jgi:predicted nucleotidyltransferase
MKTDILEQVELIVIGLDELAERVVFVGGCIPAFYVNPEKFEEPRPTEDIDCIIKLVSLSHHQELEMTLRSKGFRNIPSMIARWEYRGIVVDIMPTNKNILGFYNRWYDSALESAKEVCLPGGKTCKILDLPHFLATKFEAISGRAEDLRLSKDLEDIISVLNGCDTVVPELLTGAETVQAFVKGELSKLMLMKNRDEILDAHLSREGQRRRKIIIERIESVIRGSAK